MNAIITCVEFDDYLEITLPWNVGHFGKVLVVTSLKDKKTELLANSFENSCSYATDACFDDWKRVLIFWAEKAGSWSWTPTSSSQRPLSRALTAGS